MAGVWVVLEHPKFAREWERLPISTQKKLDAVVQILREHGPALGRPYVDTLNASRHGNMKEIRLNADGVWRFAFAFDPARNAVILVGGDKEGENQTAFYKKFIRLADARLDEWLAQES
ncbi:MAG: type II toxin-antitoxin system RelE/ParE family toxin [Candidatus Devosia phytovorans]|uniref:Type II toxin-antitoxin system RelE/ParE family toxin n=1 Tax=Candidatus Devosia phytovorans TaxID=3121372 RepID=A0AAJ6AY94_9HYPH|nr:type II toxin-antitoxin system RelE/ParE family toxin [Devosia sp.]WEK02692.1 MAG: type II toxin-antitoxin system RelE/ParE family toxin [Devosia sp.]